MKYFLLFTLFIVVFLSCDKDSFQTKPQIRVDDMSANFVRKGDSLVVTVKYTDKEGDIGKGTLWYHVRRLNQRPLPPTIPDYIPAPNTITEFPNQSSGFLDMKLLYKRDLTKGVFENDSIIIRIALTDRGGNASDTIATDMIVVERE